jgi:hypothetical protein
MATRELICQLEHAQAPPAAQTTSANLTAPTVQQIAGDVYEYNYILPTGTGPYHSVGVHRVVRVNDGKPVVSHNSVFLAHGYESDFNTFMGGTHAPRSLPVYLANNGVDVWGIDYGWSLVPSTETNFTFMQNWGLQRDIDDLEAALLFARVMRSATGSDGGRMALLGWSGSVWTGFALLNEESHRSCGFRQVRAFVPVDQPFKTINPDGSQRSVEAKRFFGSRVLPRASTIMTQGSSMRSWPAWRTLTQTVSRHRICLGPLH